MSDAALTDALLRTILEAPVIADGIEAGLDELAARLGSHLSRGTIAEAVHDALVKGFVRDPVRLPPGALQCHWHLELTSQGRQAARRVPPSTPSAE